MHLCNNLCMKNTNISHSISSVCMAAKALGLTQKAIAAGSGISQSQVSRVLSGSSKRESKAFKAICKYINSQKVRVSPELVIQNQTLINALTHVWDGSEQQASVIAEIINSLEGLCLSQKNQ